MNKSQCNVQLTPTLFYFMFCFVDIEPNELDRLKALYKGEHKKRLGIYKGKITSQRQNWDFGLV